MTTFVTSDEHIGHRNIILPTYCNRPFSSIEEMGEGLIKNHNDVVKEKDIVWHLGDFSMSERYVKDHLARLNGSHYLIMGNHDKPYKGSPDALKRYYEYGFKDIFISFCLDLSFGRVLMQHMPFYNEQGVDKRFKDKRPTQENMKLSGSKYLIHGHSHAKPEHRRKDNAIDVGVDGWNYSPVSEEQLAQFIKDTDL